MGTFYISNLNPSSVDSRDRAFTPVGAPVVLPAYVDLIPSVDEVENQAQTNSCTANAGSTALEIAYRRAGTKIDFSRLFLYWNIRELGGFVGDVGGEPRDIGKALKNFGICKESSWGFSTPLVNTKPTAEIYDLAAAFKVIEYQRLGFSGDVKTEIKQALSLGIPVLTTMWVTNSFQYLKGNWKTHKWGAATDKRTGRHEVVIIGYDDETKTFLAQNSWGKFWGDGGFFGIPYDLVDNGMVDEFWILSKLAIPYVPVVEGQDQTIFEAPNEEKKNNTVKIIVVIAFIIAVISLLPNWTL